MSLRRSAWMAIVALGTLASMPARAQTTLAADLSIDLVDQSAGDPFVYAGDPHTLTATVTNSGPNHASGITVTFTVPAVTDGTLSVSAPSGCTPAGNVFTCTLADIADGAQTALNFDVSLNKPKDAAGHVVIPVACPTADIGPFTASVAVDATVTDDLDLANNTAAPVTVPVQAWAELSVDMTGTPASLAPGGTVTYSVTVANAGPCPATGVVISDGSDEDGTAGAPNPFLTQTSTNGDATLTFAAAGPLALADIPVGGTSAATTLDYQAASELPPGVNGNDVSLPLTVGAVADTDAGDASATASVSTPIHYGKEGSGCSSVAGLDLAGLLGVAALGLRRRRKA